MDVGNTAMFYVGKQWYTSINGPCGTNLGYFTPPIGRWLEMTPSFINQPTEKGHMGVSENSVPLNPMVNDHCPY